MISKDFRIKGMVPYKFSRPFEEEKTPKTDTEKRKNAINGVYQADDGMLFIPSRQIKGVILTGVRLCNIKIEKSMARARDLIKALCYIEPAEIPIMNGKSRFMISDIQLLKVPCKTKTGEMIWKYNAILPAGWLCEFKISIHEMLEMKIIERSLTEGGFLMGIGGGRPDHGRFEVSFIA